MTHHIWNSQIAEIYKAQIERARALWAVTPPMWLNKPIGSASFESDIGPAGQVSVADESADSIAKQFYVYMPGHSFKVEYLINYLDAKYRLPLDTERGCLAIVDIGCGGATASTAVINEVLQCAAKDTRFLFVGIDNNHCAVQLYDWMMTGLRAIPELSSRIEHHAVIKGMPEALTYAAEGLYKAKATWNIPSLSDIWIIQSNVVRPLHGIWQDDKDARNRLGLNAHSGLIPDDFGEVEARAYEQLLQLTQADRMLVITVATNDMEWRDSSHEFGKSVIRVFSPRGHKPSSIHTPLDRDQPFSVSFQNPLRSFWRDKGVISPSKPSKFFADVQYIESMHFHADQDWQEIISDDNLRLAWARVRAAMLREALVDEVGLKLFEEQLDGNLKTIRDRLLTYTIRLTDFPRLFYSIPKDENNTRPRALQAIHEEILAVAVVQVLGQNVQELMSRNYGYHLALAGNTEYLYRPWFRAYGRFKNTVHKAIRGIDEEGIVLRSDISNFFPSISQERLLESVLARFRLESASRVAWLLRQLLIRNENGNKDLGVLQGPLASGFWANLYLLDLDKQFSDDYPHASFFRYVDDMVLVISNAERKDKVLDNLTTEVKSLGLNLSDSKTDSEAPEASLKGLQKDKILDGLEKRFQKLMEGLYFGRAEYHEELRAYSELEWWRFIRRYQQCLLGLGVFIEASRLSRKVWQYVQSPLLRGEMRRKIPLFALVPDSTLWVEQFVTDNHNWIEEANVVRQELSHLMKTKWAEWKQLKANPPQELSDKELKENLKTCQRYVSFTLHRLARLGYDEVLDEIVELYCRYPYVLKSHRMLLEHLVLQGHFELLAKLWEPLERATFPGASYLRALIFRCYRGAEAMQNPSLINILETISVSPRSLTHDEFLIEALMSTESLIFSSGYYPNEHQQEELYQLASKVMARCPQLARNLLILAQRGTNNAEQYEQLRSLLAELYSLSEDPNEYQEPDFSSEMPEPEILRDKYYHSRYPDNAEEFDGDYF